MTVVDLHIPEYDEGQAYCAECTEEWPCRVSLRPRPPVVYTRLSNSSRPLPTWGATP